MPFFCLCLFVRDVCEFVPKFWGTKFCLWTMWLSQIQHLACLPLQTVHSAHCGECSNRQTLHSKLLWHRHHRHHHHHYQNLFYLPDIYAAGETSAQLFIPRNSQGNVCSESFRNHPRRWSSLWWNINSARIFKTLYILSAGMTLECSMFNSFFLLCWDSGKLQHTLQTIAGEKIVSVLCVKCNSIMVVNFFPHKETFWLL